MLEMPFIRTFTYLIRTTKVHLTDEIVHNNV